VEDEGLADAAPQSVGSRKDERGNEEENGENGENEEAGAEEDGEETREGGEGGAPVQAAREDEDYTEVAPTLAWFQDQMDQRGYRLPSRWPQLP